MDGAGRKDEIVVSDKQDDRKSQSSVSCSVTAMQTGWSVTSNSATSKSASTSAGMKSSQLESDTNESCQATSTSSDDSDSDDFGHQRLSLHEAPNDSVFESNEDNSTTNNPAHSNLRFVPQQSRQAKTSASSSASASSGSSLSIALPPVTYDDLNKSRFIQESNSFFDSFFGQDQMERYFPDGKLRLAIVSWNMASKAPANYDQALQQMLKLKSYNNSMPKHKHSAEEVDAGDNLPEMFVIGLQETPKSEVIVTNTKVGIQAVLGPNYALLHWSAFGALHISIWLRRELLWSCTLVHTRPVHVRSMAANQVRTKGAISLSFNLFGASFLFINTHLSAHEGNLRTRIAQLEKIQATLNIARSTAVLDDHSEKSKKPDHAKTKRNSIKLPKRSASAKRKMIKRSEYIFWFGDLNFRLELPINTVLSLLSSVRDAQDEQSKLKLQNELMRCDQLTNLMNRGLVFQGFEEAALPLPFLPTYKCRINRKHAPRRHSPSSVPKLDLDKSSSLEKVNAKNEKQSKSIGSEQSIDSKLGDLKNIYNFEAKRVPSYTDRILFQTKINPQKANDPMIVCEHYDSIESMCSSDHKPIYALFEIKLVPGGPSLPGRLKQLDQHARLGKHAPKLSKSYLLFGNRLTRRAGVGRLEKRMENEVSNSNLANAMSASLSSLPAVGELHNQRSMVNVNDKLMRLNAGAFDRQVYLEGLRLRNTMLKTISVDHVPARSHGLHKSHSLDSSIGETGSAGAAVPPQPAGLPLRLPISPLVTQDDILLGANNLRHNESAGLDAQTKPSGVCLIS